MYTLNMYDIPLLFKWQIALSTKMSCLIPRSNFYKHCFCSWATEEHKDIYVLYSIELHIQNQVLNHSKQGECYIY